MLDHPHVRRFIALVTGWNAEGWAEYLLWETLGGLRNRPFALLDPLTAEDMAVLRALRDELNVWPYWDAPRKRWALAHVGDWKEHAEETSADDAIAILSSVA